MEFVDTLVRLAAQKASRDNKCPAQAFSDLLQRCVKAERAQKTFSRSSLGPSPSVHSGFLAFATSKDHTDDEKIFELLSSNLQEEYRYKDQTITLHTLARYVKLNSLDASAKYKFYKYFTKFYDVQNELSESTIARLAEV